VVERQDNVAAARLPEVRIPSDVERTPTEAPMKQSPTGQDGASTRPEASEWKPSFVRLLEAALRERGVDVARNLRLPGASASIDVFIPNLPRAAVMVSTATRPQVVASKASDVAATLRAMFSSELRLFIVLDRQALERCDACGAIPAGSVPAVVDPAAELDGEASRVADDVLHELDRVRTGHFALPRLARLRIGTGAASDGEGADRVADASPATAHRRAATSSQGPHCLEEDEGFLLKRMHRQAERERRACAAATKVLLASFQDVAPGRYDVLAQEVSALEAEFARQHFTACALRVGRCLERIVYSVAEAWSVPVDEVVLDVCAKLRGQVQEIGRGIVEYRDLASPSKREAAKRRLRELGAGLNALVIEALMQLDEPHDSKPVTPDTPKNVDAILRDIRRAYAPHDAIRRRLDELLDKDLTRKILDVRNDAAHARPEGPREVDRATVLRMLDDVNEVLRALSLIGEDMMALRAARTDEAPVVDESTGRAKLREERGSSRALLP
jgi:hypothetical protein